jgi:polyhydroxybutyrate depolymerase
VRFWNATPECCDFQTPKVNDDAYIMSVIDQISESYNVDRNRIYVIGHSNGGFMANELACAHSDRIAAVVDIAGGNFGKLSLCKPTAPISILELWGTKDVTYKQNHIMGKYIAGALTSIEFWAKQEKCSTPTFKRAELDLDRKVIGRETDLISYSDCSGTSSVQLWRMNGVNHVPALSTSFSADLIDFLFAHPKSAQ